MLVILSVVLSIMAFIAFVIGDRSVKKQMRNKKILIIGGSSGLGYSLAKILYKLGNRVVITSRSKNSLEKLVENIRSEPLSIYSKDEIVDSSIEGIALDVEDEKSFPANQTSYDIIFCCPGKCTAKYFKDMEVDEFSREINLNYLGVLRSLKHFKDNNTRPFTFVAINSTTSMFTFPGYSCYAASKSALYSFYDSVRMELERDQIDFRLLNCGTMRTPGLKRENRCKPRFTRDMEYSNTVSEADDAAKYYVDNLYQRKVLAYDWFTYFTTIRHNCEKRMDYFMFPIGLLVICFGKFIVKNKFQSVKID